MKLKSLLFGSAASLAAFTGAQAADLPTAEPVEYVAICDAYGAGYFFIPGGDTCLKISGFAFAEAAYIPRSRGTLDIDPGPGDFQNNYGTRVRAQVNFDARTSTGLGVLRSFIALRGNVDDRPRGGGGAAGATAGNGVIVQEAYAQLQMDSGTITAGLAASAFDFFGSYADEINGISDDPTDNVTQLSYSTTIAGFKAVISFEDPQSTGTHNFKNGVGAGAVNDEAYLIGGRDYPDLVGALGYEAAWGAVQLSGVLGRTSEALGGGDEIGYAVALGGRVGFGMFEASAQATYADGLIGYATTGVGLAEFSDADSNTGYDNNSAWSIRGGVQANFTDTIFANINGSYARYNDKTNDPGPDEDGHVWTVAGDLGWKPVPGLSVVGEVEYANASNNNNPDGDIWAPSECCLCPNQPLYWQ
jgi:opacity protein-like surface antigen